MTNITPGPQFSFCQWSTKKAVSRVGRFGLSTLYRLGLSDSSLLSAAPDVALTTKPLHSGQLVRPFRRPALPPGTAWRRSSRCRSRSGWSWCSWPPATGRCSSRSSSRWNTRPASASGGGCSSPCGRSSWTPSARPASGSPPANGATRGEHGRRCAGGEYVKVSWEGKAVHGGAWCSEGMG